jgi:DNA-binding NarL/FixJ family response regulator
MVRNSVLSPGTDQRVTGESSVLQRRVVVADDQPRMLDAVAALLARSFEVMDLVSDGQAALEATLKLNPDLVVLDISMPGMSGIEVAKELRKSANSAKIVFLTVYEDAQILATCLTAGGLGYVVKEVMENDLVPAMNEALAGRVFVSRFLPRRQRLNPHYS